MILVQISNKVKRHLLREVALFFDDYTILSGFFLLYLVLPALSGFFLLLKD
jgi:hypothetical protein